MVDRDELDDECADQTVPHRLAKQEVETPKQPDGHPTLESRRRHNTSKQLVPKPLKRTDPLSAEAAREKALPVATVAAKARPKPKAGAVAPSAQPPEAKDKQPSAPTGKEGKDKKGENDPNEKMKW